MVHWRLVIEAPRSWRMVGSATLTMEMSITTTTMLAQQIASTSSLRRRVSSVLMTVDGAVMSSTLGFRACSKSTKHSPNPG